MMNWDDIGPIREKKLHKALSSWTRLSLVMYNVPKIRILEMLKHELETKNRSVIVTKLTSRYCSLVSREIKAEVRLKQNA